MKTGWPRHLLALGGFGLLAAILWFHRIHLDAPQEYGLAASDIFRFTWPEVVYAWQRIQAGELPLWNPYQLAGIPFSSLQSRGLFYPPNMLFLQLAPSPARVIALQAITHLAAAGFFSWLLCNRLGMSTAACITAAFSFMLSTQIFNDFYHPVWLSTMVWLPAIFWAVIGLVQRPEIRRVLVLGIVIALCFLGGYAQGFLYSVQLGAAWGIFCLFAFGARKERLRTAGLGALAGLIAVGLMSVQLLPALELAQQGTRDLGGLSLWKAARFSFGTKALLHEIFAGFVPILGATKPWTLPVYLSLFALPLLVAGGADRERRKVWLFFLVAAVVSGMFTLGGKTPIFAFYHALPLGDLFRSPSRMLFVWVFCFSVLAGIGVEGIQRFSGSIFPLERRHTSGKWRDRSLVFGLVPLLIAAAVGIDLYARTDLQFSHPVLQVDRPYAPPGLIRDLRKRGGTERVFLERIGSFAAFPGDRPRSGLSYKLGTFYQLFTVPDYDPQLPGAYRDYFFGDEVPPFWHGAITLTQTNRAVQQNQRLRLLDLMSVRFYAAPRKEPGPRRASRRRTLRQVVGGEVRTLPQTIVIERPSALPRTWVVARTVQEPDARRAAAQLRSAEFEPSEVAILEDALPELEHGALADHSPTASSGESRILRFAPEEVVIEATCLRPNCLVVLTDLYYPGWEATVDGVNAPLRRTNVLYRGIAIGRGTHRIVYRYRPTSLYLGAAVSALTILVMFTAWLYSRRHQS
ncbi:MAG: hypothetical protein P8K07_11945 [Candidatus Binatia bacterium]|nr:hypothetical protein [Candidatus Binatia bacterium]